MHRLLFIIALLVSCFSYSICQSGPAYRRTSIMDSNQVKCVFTNWGVMGQPALSANRGAWQNPNNGYLGDLSIFIGAEVTSGGKTFHSVVTCPENRPVLGTDTDPVTGKFWTFEPVQGYCNADGQKVATSNDPSSWPSTWPDHPDWVDKDGHAAWNGLFGTNMLAGVQESYFVMDDNNDERFNFPANNSLGVAFKPDSINQSRNGLGLRVAVRYVELADTPYCDVLYRVHDITNEGTTDYEKVVFGTLTGTYVGITSTEDYHEYADDASLLFHSDNVIVTYDWDGNMANPLFVGPSGYVAEAFVEQPGTDQIAAWKYFVPSVGINLAADETLWSWMVPGTYSIPSSLINDSTASRGDDGDYIYGGNYFPLAAKQTKRVVTLLAYGTTSADVRRKVGLARNLWKEGLKTHFLTTVASDPQIPPTWTLSQNYPNPFNPLTTIRYAVPKRSQVTLTVFNTLGQQVATLVSGEVEAGYHEVMFNATDLASGVYLYRLRAGVFTQTKKLCVVK